MVLQKGVGLIEVLVALVILSIGLIGLSGMFAQSISISHSAYMRSLASIQAMDIAERIRANVLLDHDEDSYSMGTLTASEVSVDGCATTSDVINCKAAECNTQQLINWDLFQWCENNKALFSGLFVAAAVELDDTDYIIGIEWQERGQNIDVPTSSSGIENVFFKYQMRLR